MERNRKTATIYDVAEMVGTSPRSVTRAFQQDSGISEKTRQKILAAAEEIGYRPNKAAGRMRGKSVRIACLIECAVDVFVDEVIRGMKIAADALRDFKTEVLIRPCETMESFQDALDEITALPVDGVVVMSTKIPEKYLQLLKKHRIPVIYIVLEPACIDQEYRVQSDTLMKWKMAGSMLSLTCTDMGKLAIFAGRLEQNYLQEYLGGFRETLTHAAQRTVDVYETEDIADAAQKFALDIIQSGKQYDGIFFASANSVPAIEVFRKHRYNAKIIASDVFPMMSEYIRDDTVAATIYQNPEKQARLAVMQMYQHLVQHDAMLKTVKIRPQLVLAGNLEAYEHRNLSEIPDEITEEGT